MLKSLTHPHMNDIHARVMKGIPDKVTNGPVQTGVVPGSKAIPKVRLVPAGVRPFLAKKKAASIIK